MGINDFGTFGVGQPQSGQPPLSGLDIGTGFQMPAGQAHENLAIGWWGEGYLVEFHFSGGFRAFYPSEGVHGTIERVDDFYLDSDRYIMYRVTVAFPALGTGDPTDGVLVDFEFTLDKQKCDVTLRTHFQNQSDYTISVTYKRIIDWDNLEGQGSSTVFESDFRVSGNTVVATRRVDRVPLYECRTSARGVTLPYFIDANAWDDLFGGGAAVETQLTGDGNAGFTFLRYGLPPGGTWDTVLVYDCSYLVPYDPPRIVETVRDCLEPGQCRIDIECLPACPSGGRP